MAKFMIMNPDFVKKELHFQEGQIWPQKGQFKYVILFLAICR